MSQIWLVTTNDRTLLPCILSAADITEDQLSASKPIIYGSAMFAHGGEVLLLKRPLEPGVQFNELVDASMRSNRYLALFEPLPDSGFQIQNSQPFRYKGWVMGMSGDQPPAINIDSLPEEEANFVRLNTRGQSSEEVFFHRVMAGLLAQGTTAFAEPTPTQLVDTVQSVLDTAINKRFAKFTIWLTNDHFSVVMAHGRPVFYRRITIPKHCPRCSDGIIPTSTEFEGIAHAHLEATLVTDGWDVHGNAWKPLQQGQALIINETMATVLLTPSPPKASSS